MASHTLAQLRAVRRLQVSKALALGSFLAACVQPSVVPPCADFTWGKPDTLLSTRGPAYVESPEVVHDSRQVVLLGGPTWVRTPDGVVTAAGLRVPRVAGGRLGTGTIVDLPPGHWTLSVPRAASIDAGIAVAWRGGVPQEQGSDTVFSAVLTGNGWTRTAVLSPSPSMSDLSWSGGLVSAVGTLAGKPVMAAYRRLSEPMAFLTGESSGWSADTGTIRSGTYPQLAASRGRTPARVVLAYNASAGRGRGNTQYVAHSDDDGRSWRRAIRLSPDSANRAHRSRLFATSSGGFVLTWIEEASADVPARIRVAVNTGATDSWKVEPPVAVGDGQFMAAALDGSDNLHVLVSSPASPRIRHIVYAAAGFKQSELPSVAGLVVPTPTLVHLGADTVMAVWSVAASQTGHPMTVYSSGFNRCISYGGSSGGQTMIVNQA